MRSQTIQRLGHEFGLEEALNMVAKKRAKIEELFIPERTVSNVLRMLKGLNRVKPMTLNEVYDDFPTDDGFEPLQELADGMSYTFPKENEGDSQPEYLLHRNDESMVYVINIDELSLID